MEGPPGDGMAALAFAAVIPVKNRPDDLRNVIAALLAQTLPPVELVIVDQSESDACVRAAHEAYGKSGVDGLSKLTYVHDTSIDGLTAARNVGIARSTAPAVAFFDDDAVPEPDALMWIARALEEDPRLVAAGGIITNYQRPSALYRWLTRIFMRGAFWDDRQPVYWNWANFEPGQVVPVTRLTGSLMAFRRQALLAIRGFDPRYRGASVGEDIEISQRLLAVAGPGALALVGGARLHHRSRGNWKKTDRSLEFQVVAFHYLYRKNLPPSLPNLLRLFWLITGLMVIAFIMALGRWSPDPLRSFWAGVRCVRNGYRDCPFLKSEPAL